MKILKGKLTDEIKKAIFDGFKEHAIEKCGVYAIEEPISFYIIGSDKNVIAAIVCQLFCGALRVKYLWTHKNYRNKGYASKLMHEAFKFAKKHNCPFASVETMNFQAPNFYKKFGFKVQFKRDGYANGISVYYMKKDFD